MARLDVSGLNDIMDLFEDLGQGLDEVCDDMLRIGAGDVQEEIKLAAEQAGHRDSGAMIRSVTFSHTPKQEDDRKRITVYFKGKDSKGVKNGQKAFSLNFGTRFITGSRFFDKASRSSAPRAEADMRYIWNLYHQKKGMKN